jgi:hypothetical protein
VIVRHVPHALIPDYLTLGWEVMIPARYACHDHYSAQMRWRCQCEPREPQRTHEGQRNRPEGGQLSWRRP